MPTMSALTILLTASAILGAQTFDAASIRPNPSASSESSIARSGGRLTMSNSSLRDSIEFAYGIPVGREFQLVGPGWLDTEKFDIVATFPAETSREQIREMLKAMLAERFGLKTHNENHQIQSYALVVSKKGAKLKPNPDPRDDGAFLYAPGHATMRAISMAGFANRLSGSSFQMDRPVVDMTELKGAWDFALQWSSDGVPPDGIQSPSLFTALEEQAGLRLESRKLTFPILIVDSASRTPTAN
jgi:uncharacterized protein (TIGR03435 family)